mmetsp:Transcript_14506/g.32954  ORF Transcript_14506/g.32954 Transcript_14506/m.32954 type:complete len:450 (-) Transcript_14506:105-1454(-)
MANPLVMNWLGQGGAKRRRVGQPEAEEPKQAARTKVSKAQKDKPKGQATRNALRFGALEPPAKKLKGRIAGKAEALKKRPKPHQPEGEEARESESETRQSESSDSEVAREAARSECAQAPSPSPAASSSKVVRSCSVASEASQKTVPESDVMPPSEAGTGTFQDAVLERLKSLCGDSEDATVLAEYVVIMCAGNKGREEMVAELVPFFGEDQGQAQSFIQWVEECKWKFLVGAEASSLTSRPPEVATAPAASARAKAAHVDSSDPVATAPAATESQLTKPQSQRFRQPSPIHPGPHVAVTSKCVLQPSPAFEAEQKQTSGTSVFAQVPTLPTARARAAVTAKVVEDAKHPAVVGHFSKAAAAAKVVKSPLKSLPVVATSGIGVNTKQQKASLAENMTKKLREIVSKLSDKTLSAEVRAKYQGMAQTLQAQLTKITSENKPPSKPARARR